MIVKHHRYYEGYNEAMQKMERANLETLLACIDDLQGRGNLKYGDDIEAVRREALRQIEIEWTNPEYHGVAK